MKTLSIPTKAINKKEVLDIINSLNKNKYSVLWILLFHDEAKMVNCSYIDAILKGLNG